MTKPQPRRRKDARPAELLDDVWERLAEAQPLIRHLGLQR